MKLLVVLAICAFLTIILNSCHWGVHFFSSDKGVQVMDIEVVEALTKEDMELEAQKK